MGNKIITTKDYWVCSMGAVPAQLQGTRKSTKKESGDVYITVEDKATSSWIDFGCKRYMILMALIAAVLVVGAIVLGVITVATGGLGLIAIGALAGLAGGILGAVVGGLLCGQKVASKRTWSKSKNNLISQQTTTITGDCFMTCAAGGIVKFAPEIKSWGGALAFAATSYGLSLIECAVAGAAVGAGGQSIAPMLVANGGAGVALTFSASNILGNLAFSVTGLRGAMALARGAGGADKVLHDYATDDLHGAGSVAESFAEGASPEYAITKSICNSGLNWSNGLSAALYIAFLLAGVKGKAPVPEGEPIINNDKPPEAKSEPAAAPEAEPEVQPTENNGKKGDAFEEGGSGKPKVVSKEGKTAKEHAYEEMKKRIDDVNNKVINPKTKQPYGKKHIPKSLEVAVNKKTGEIIIGENGTLNKGNPTPELHPKTKEMFKESNNEDWNEKNCSEADVADQIHKKGQSTDDYEYHAVEVDGDGNIRDKHTCENCDVNMKDPIDKGDVTSNTKESQTRRDDSKSKN